MGRSWCILLHIKAPFECFSLIGLSVILDSHTVSRPAVITAALLVRSPTCLHDGTKYTTAGSFCSGTLNTRLRIKKRRKGVLKPRMGGYPNSELPNLLADRVVSTPVDILLTPSSGFPATARRSQIPQAFAVETLCDSI